jgi:hypothetical protein
MHDSTVTALRRYGHGLVNGAGKFSHPLQRHDSLLQLGQQFGTVVA